MRYLLVLYILAGSVWIWHGRPQHDDTIWLYPRDCGKRMIHGDDGYLGNPTYPWVADRWMVTQGCQNTFNVEPVEQ